MGKDIFVSLLIEANCLATLNHASALAWSLSMDLCTKINLTGLEGALIRQSIKNLKEMERWHHFSLPFFQPILISRI